MAQRTKQVQDAIEQSEKDKIQAKALLSQYEAQLRSAEMEAETIIRNAKENAQQEAEKIIAQSRVFAEETIVNARKQLEAERRVALEIFREEAATLVISASSQILSREIKTEDSLSYANMLLKGTSSL